MYLDPKRQYEEILYLMYDPCENSFYDDDNFHINNIQDILMPSDLFFFRNDYEFNTFVHRYNKDVLCIIAIYGEEVVA